MDLRFVPMDEASARTILAWRYDGEYAFYNCPPEEVETNVSTFVDPANGYYAVQNGISRELLGFCCFGPDAQVPGGDYCDERAVDLGLGLRPDLTGRGLGKQLVLATLDFGRTKLGYSSFRLTVAAFNRRAIRVYERAGFRIVRAFGQETPTGAREWLQMLSY
jgi:RimJ/RimL family protein N-acetyltransferase